MDTSRERGRADDSEYFYRNMEMSFAERLDKIRNTESYRIEKAKLDFICGISQAMRQQAVIAEELADRIGRSHRYVSKMLRGDIDPTLELMVRVSGALGCVVRVEVCSETERVSQVVSAD